MKVFVLLSIIVAVAKCDYFLEDINIELLKPKGLKITVAGDDDLELMYFEGDVNNPISVRKPHMKRFFILDEFLDTWSVLDRKFKMKNGEVLFYKIHGKKNGEYFEEEGEYKFDGKF